MILSFRKCRFPTKRQTLLFFRKKKGGGVESDGIQESPQLVQSGHQSGPDASGFEPTAFIWLWTMQNFHLFWVFNPLHLLRQRWTNKRWHKSWPHKTVSLISMNSLICIISKGCLSFQDIFSKLTENGCFLIWLSCFDKSFIPISFLTLSPSYPSESN